MQVGGGFSKFDCAVPHRTNLCTSSSKLACAVAVCISCAQDDEKGKLNRLEKRKPQKFVWGAVKYNGNGGGGGDEVLMEMRTGCVCCVEKWASAISQALVCKLEIKNELEWVFLIICVCIFSS